MADSLLTEQARMRISEAGVFRGLQSYSVGGPVTITDDFNRADGAPGANWTFNSGDYSIATNKLQRNIAGAVNDYCFWTTPCTTDDQYVEADVVGSNTQFLVLNLRGSGVLATGSQTYYEFFIVPSTNQVKINKVVNFVESNLVTTSFTHGNAHKVRFEAIGTSLKGYVDGVLIAQVTDSSITTGKYVGVNCSSLAGTPGTYDNFAAGDLTTFSTSQVGYENSGKNAVAGDVDGNITLAIDAGTGINRVLWVFTANFGSTAQTATYNGVTMTLVDRTLNGNQEGWWYLQNPASGTNNLVVNGASAGDNLITWIVTNNTKQSGTPYVNYATDTGNGTTHAKAITVPTDHMGIWNDCSGNTISSPNQDDRQINNLNGGSAIGNTALQTQEGTGASITGSWTNNGDLWFIIALAAVPA